MALAVSFEAVRPVVGYSICKDHRPVRIVKCGRGNGHYLVHFAFFDIKSL